MASQWVVKTANGEVGPFSAEQLRKLAAAKRISGSTFVRPAKEKRWIAAGRVGGVFDSPKFPSKEDGVWSEPLDDTDESSLTDANIDGDAILDMLADVESPTSETASLIPVPPPPPPSPLHRASGRQKAARAEKDPAGTRTFHGAAAADEESSGRTWSPLRLTLVLAASAAGAALVLDLAVRFALTMATAESHQTLGLFSGVVAPFLRDGGLLLALLALGAAPLFWLNMLIHCLKHEKRGGIEKLTWTLVLLSLNILGAVLYYAIERPRVEAERR